MSELERRLSREALEVLRQLGAPGAAVALVSHGEPVFGAVFGLAAGVGVAEARFPSIA